MTELRLSVPLMSLRRGEGGEGAGDFQRAFTEALETELSV